MNHGLLVRADGTIQAWTWGDRTSQNPIEFPTYPGDQLLDLSEMSEDEQLTVIEIVRHGSQATRDRLLASVPTITLPLVPNAPAGHVTCVQPGLRRICHRPTKEWHQEEMAARFVSNLRIKDGEPVDAVIEEEFTHLAKKEKQNRRDRHNGGPFPLTPMVVLIERKKALPDGTETVETLRQFAFHEPVSEF